MAEKRDYYEVLGLQKGASAIAIKEQSTTNSVMRALTRTLRLRREEIPSVQAALISAILIWATFSAHSSAAALEAAE